MRETNEQDDSLKNSSSAKLENSPKLRMRCPTCRKLYSLDAATVVPATAPLKFECVSCHSRFSAFIPASMPSHSASLSRDPGLSGRDGRTLDTFIDESSSAPLIPTPVMPAPKARVAVASREASGLPAQALLGIRPCPKCGNESSFDASECKVCGIVFTRFRAVERAAVAEPVASTERRELTELWDLVMANYNDRAQHDRFLNACVEAQALTFASHKYARILAVSPDEEIARAMRSRIVGFASHRLEKSSVKSGWSFRIPGLNGLVICLGTIVCVVGSLLPGLGNLTGIGGSMVALAIGVRFVLKRPV